MNDIDEKIRKALNAEDQKILDQFGAEPGPIGLVLETFKGSQWWFTAGIWFFGFAVFALFLYFTFNYFAAEDIKTSLSWGIGILLCGMAMVIVKIGAWQQMQTQNLMREIKKLELRWLASMQQQNQDS
jgi:hypothetical protein